MSRSQEASWLIALGKDKALILNFSDRRGQRQTKEVPKWQTV
jgi:hypothetical protein